MKSEKKSGMRAVIKLLIATPMLFAIIIGTGSCGKSGNTKASVTENAPPPPPPPPVPAADSAYINVDEMPVFKNGETGLMQYIFKNTKYPEEARKNNIHGRVLVKFVVNKDCTVSGVELVQGVNPSLDAEALRVVATLPKFEKAALKDGVQVNVVYTIPIQFNLQ